MVQPNSYHKKMHRPEKSGNLNPLSAEVQTERLATRVLQWCWTKVKDHHIILTDGKSNYLG